MNIVFHSLCVWSGWCTALCVHPSTHKAVKDNAPVIFNAGTIRPIIIFCPPVCFCSLRLYNLWASDAGTPPALYNSPPVSSSLLIEALSQHQVGLVHNRSRYVFWLKSLPDSMDWFIKPKGVSPHLQIKPAIHSCSKMFEVFAVHAVGV